MVVCIGGIVYTTKIKMGRFLTNAADQGLHVYVDRVEEECYGVGSIPKLGQCARALITFSCFFYTLFLFDTLGDSEGFRGALWVLILVPLIPAVLVGCFVLYNNINYRCAAGNGANRGGNIEMCETGRFTSQPPTDTLHTDIETDSSRDKVVGLPCNDNVFPGTDDVGVSGGNVGDTTVATAVNIAHQHTMRDGSEPIVRNPLITHRTDDNCL